ncbi:MAG: penicillin-binding protein 2 [Nitrospirota bacterium]|jgi:penicillin-binding protein 2
MNDENVKDRIRPIVGVVAILFFVLTFRLWQLQVVRGSEYKELSAENRLRVEKMPAPRGIIFDRNGIPLVKNSAFYSVSLLPEMAQEADVGAISRFLDVPPEEILGKIEDHPSPLVTIKLKEGLTFEETAAVEARLSDYPGLTIDVEQTRHYIFGEVGAHLVGYLGRIRPEQARDPAYEGVPPQSFIGQWGVEKLYDRHLRGTPGRRVIEVDALGRQLRILTEEPPRRGSDLYLSMDVNLQMASEEAFGDRAGALAALKPDTGEVLGLVSRPSFDPNLFSRGIGPSDWRRLSRGERYPLLNRALQSQYPPGSTFKILTAIAGLESGAIDTKEKVYCSGRVRLGRWTFGCWKPGGHGNVSLHRAIVESCDIYFYKAGEKIGIDTIAEYARMFGLGSATGIPLVQEKSGLVPDREWKRRALGEPWYMGETYNTSIGQGFVLATPMQLARMMSTVANGGNLYSPGIVRPEELPRPVSRARVGKETLDFVRHALGGVVNERHGTGRAALSSFTEIAGKTGTAQVISLKKRKELERLGMMEERFRDHAWFVAFAPEEEPEIALAVFVEHGGHGGSAAAPIAKKAIEAYMASLEEHAEDRQKTDN